MSMSYLQWATLSVCAAAGLASADDLYVVSNFNSPFYESAASLPDTECTAGSYAQIDNWAGSDPVWHHCAVRSISQIGCKCLVSVRIHTTPQVYNAETSNGAVMARVRIGEGGITEGRTNARVYVRIALEEWTPGNVHNGTHYRDVWWREQYGAFQVQQIEQALRGFTWKTGYKYRARVIVGAWSYTDDQSGSVAAMENIAIDWVQYLAGVENCGNNLDTSTSMWAVPDDVVPNGSVTLRGTQFSSNTDVTITCAGQLLGTAHTLADGTFVAIVAAPAAYGSPVVRATDTEECFAELALHVVCGAPGPLADVEADCDVDLADFAILQCCYDSPGYDCPESDRTVDDVLHAAEQCWNGPEVPVAWDCPQIS
jgi:hypothetical protein